jgi:hypothetical protein
MNRGDGTAPQPHPVPEPQDRIDMVYYGGAQLEVIDSRRSGPLGGNVTEELEIARFPSDHNAVTSTFLLRGFDHTRLTFRSLGANGEEIPAGYGSRVLSSPGIAVDFSAAGSSPERPAAWRYVDDSLWPKGVASLNSGEGESADGTATFRLLWTPDEAAAVHVDSFRLLDYPDGNGIGQTVRWELWGSDALMADGLASVPDDAQLQVTTGLAGAFAEPLELRLTHMDGVNDALGLDDLVFRQVIVPEPSSLVLLLLCLLSAPLRLRG